jgi:hypothetical protein
MESGGQHGPGGLNGSAGMSKAERFEYEKRRIVDSCFNKKDDDGSCKTPDLTPPSARSKVREHWLT